MNQVGLWRLRLCRRPSGGIYTCIAGLSVILPPCHPVILSAAFASLLARGAAPTIGPWPLSGGPRFAVQGNWLLDRLPDERAAMCVMGPGFEKRL